MFQKLFHVIINELQPAKIVKISENLIFAFAGQAHYNRRSNVENYYPRHSRESAEHNQQSRECQKGVAEQVDTLGSKAVEFEREHPQRNEQKDCKYHRQSQNNPGVDCRTLLSNMPSERAYKECAGGGGEADKGVGLCGVDIEFRKAQSREKHHNQSHERPRRSTAHLQEECHKKQRGQQTETNHICQRVKFFAHLAILVQQSCSKAVTEVQQCRAKHQVEGEGE